MFEQLREAAGMGGPTANLANQLLVIRQQYENQELSSDDYQYLIQQVAQVKAAQDLSNDEQAFRFIVAAAEALSLAL
jgi:hypothetical protein